jgi:hypothetical protein
MGAALAAGAVCDGTHSLYACKCLALVAAVASRLSVYVRVFV